MANNCRACGWWPLTATGPAWCWRKRGVRTSEHEGELTVAPAVLAALPLAGRVVSGDALYCQRSVCQYIVDHDGDYLLTLKENQPELFEEVALLFDQPPPGEVFAMAEHYDKGHGRVEARRLWASAALADYLDWPGVRQVCKVERVVHRNGGTTREVRYAITSLGETTRAGRLLACVRGHWSIENRLHYVRDETFGEDRSQIRSGAAPEVMAALRNLVIGLLRQSGQTNIAAALRQQAWQPGAALKLLGISPP